MRKRMSAVFLLFMWAWLVTAGSTFPAQAAHSAGSATGLLEVDCNIAGIKLHLCPINTYAPEERRVFFGLIKSVKYVCSGEEILVGETPLKPTAVKGGRYILMIPSDYVWEGEGPLEVTIRPGEKTYFLLKLFSSRANPPESNHGGGGGGGGGAR